MQELTLRALSTAFIFFTVATKSLLVALGKGKASRFRVTALRPRALRATTLECPNRAGGLTVCRTKAGKPLLRSTARFENSVDDAVNPV